MRTVRQFGLANAEHARAAVGWTWGLMGEAERRTVTRELRRLAPTPDGVFQARGALVNLSLLAQARVPPWAVPS